MKIVDITDDKINENKKPSINNKLDKLLLELKIISNIKEYDKICVRDNIMIDTPHLLQSVSRTYNGDSREKSIKHIQKVIEDIFEILDNLLEEKPLYFKFTLRSIVCQGRDTRPTTQEILQLLIYMRYNPNVSTIFRVLPLHSA